MAAAVPEVELPVIDFSIFFDKKEGWEAECAKVADSLHRTGILLVKDPRVAEERNEAFLDMLEDYFNQPSQDTAADIHPEVHFQVGATPAFVEQARPHCDKVALLDDKNKPWTICPPEADPKWRFFWRIGERPQDTQFNSLNAPQVIPAKFPQWTSVMDGWGGLMLNACLTVAEMAAVGMQLPADEFTKRMNMGPHLLAPTGSDLNTFAQEGVVFANYHYDLNFLTIHGRSRYPGLFAWLRDGTKFSVKVPAGTLLLQAGKQFEWLTGGHILAGFHEVVVTKDTLAAVEKRKAVGRPLWRVSSTLFSHIASDVVLEPVGQFGTDEAKALYPATPAGIQVEDELKAIKLAIKP